MTKINDFFFILEGSFSCTSDAVRKRLIQWSCDVHEQRCCGLQSGAWQSDKSTFSPQGQYPSLTAVQYGFQHISLVHVYVLKHDVNCDSETLCVREWDRWLLAQRRRRARSGSPAQALLAASGIWLFLLQPSFSSEGQLTINHRRLRQQRLATAVSVAWKRASSFGKNVCGAGRRALPAGSGQCCFWEKQGWLQLVSFWRQGYVLPR